MRGGAWRGEKKQKIKRGGTQVCDTKKVSEDAVFLKHRYNCKKRKTSKRIDESGCRTQKKNGEGKRWDRTWTATNPYRDTSTKAPIKVRGRSGGDS